MERKLPNPALIASLAPKNFDDARRLVGLVPPAANAIEWRLDLSLSRISARALFDLDPRCAIMTTRSVREGGKFAGSPEEYRSAAQSAYDTGASVDVEIESGMLADPGFLPDRSRVIASRHAPDLIDIERVRRLCASGVAAVKLVRAPCGSVTAAAECLAVQRELAGLPAACFATGSRGSFTRVLSALSGGALVYGSVGDATADGQFSLSDLLDLYRARRRDSALSIFGIYGANVLESLSPRIHNALFARAGLAAVYVPIQATTSYRDREAFGADLAGLERAGVRIAGLSVTNPFKEVCFDTGRADAAVLDAGAANTLVRADGGYDAMNTDLVAMSEIVDRLGLAGQKLLVVGSGGAARAALAAGRRAGCSLALTARRPESAAQLRDEFGAEQISPEPGSRFDAIVNATPIGRRSDDPLPVSESLLEGRPAVIDFAYRQDGETSLIGAARGLGLRTADGLEFLARQAVGQARAFGVGGATFEEIAGTLRPPDPGTGAA